MTHYLRNVIPGVSVSQRELLKLYSDRVLPIVVLIIAIFLRLHNLDTIPRGLLWDEAHNGLDALRILNGELPIFLTENSGREALFVYLQAISVALLGQNSLALRVVSALLGILTVVASYALVRRMFSARIALLTCGWLTISLWHVIFSRIGLRAISLPLFLAVGFYCLWRGLEGIGVRSTASSQSVTMANGPRPFVWFALGGTVIGLSLYTYSTARFAPFVIVALALYLALVHRRLLHRALPGLVLALALATVVFLPEGLFFLLNPESFLERAQHVWAFNPELNKGNPVRALFDSAIRSLGMFAIQGDNHWDRNISGRPIFDPLSAMLMLMGIALSARRFREPAYGFTIIWLIVMFVPSLLAIMDTPNYLRVTGLIPAIFILPSLGVARLWEVWESRGPAILRALPIFLVTLSFFGGTFHTYHSYFVIWPKAPEVAQLFIADRFATLQIALRLARMEYKPILMSGGEYHDPRVPFILSGRPEAKYIRTFDAERSIIFPADHARANYLLTWSPPHAPMMGRYFDNRSAQVVEIAPSDRPITLHSLLNPRPAFEPELPVSARFGEQVLVYGFDLPRDVRAGGTMTVRWYWRLLATDEQELAFTNQLLGWDGQRRGQLDDLGFVPSYWPPGTSGISTFVINVDPEAPAGAYWLNLAVYELYTQKPNLPVFDPHGNPAGNRVQVGPIKVHGLPPAPSPEGLLPSPPVPDNPLRARLSDDIDLLGYDIGDDTLKPGGSLDLTLYWTPRGRPTRDYTVFLHLLDSQGQLRAQADSPPTSGMYPTSVWDAGESIADFHTIVLPTDLPAGNYTIAMGLYDPQTGQRLPIMDENGQTSGDHVTISGIAVVPE